MRLVETPDSRTIRGPETDLRPIDENAAGIGSRDSVRPEQSSAVRPGEKEITLINSFGQHMLMVTYDDLGILAGSGTLALPNVLTGSTMDIAVTRLDTSSGPYFEHIGNGCTMRDVLRQLI